MISHLVVDQVLEGHLDSGHMELLDGWAYLLRHECLSLTVYEINNSLSDSKL